MSRRARGFVLALLVLLAAVLLEGGFAGFAAWKSRQPYRTFKVDFGFNPMRQDGLENIAFVGTDRLAVTIGDADDLGRHRACEVWSIEKAAVERTLPVFPSTLDPWTGRGVLASGGGDGTELMDLTTGLATPLAFAGDVQGVGPRAEVFATITSSGSVELRSVKDGSLRHAIRLPEGVRVTASPTGGPNVLLAARGGRVAVTTGEYVTLVGDVATGTWRSAGPGTPLMLTPSGVVLAPWDGAHWTSPVFMGAGGPRELLAPAVNGFVWPCAFVASGERFACRSLPARKPPAEIVVVATETGAVLGHFHARPGEEVLCLALSAEGERFAVAYVGGLVEIWEIPRD
jgi:hypothetical protein